MLPSYHFISKGPAKLHYSIFGRGPKHLICFHGFGLSSEQFLPLESILGEEYTIYCFDLFFHGKSTWEAKGTPISEEFWLAIITEFLGQHQLGRFSLMGYSIGAKLVWVIAQQFPSRIDTIYAIAPDGLTISPWYSISTGNSAGRYLLRMALSRSTSMKRVLSLGRFLKLVPTSTIRFAASQLGSSAARERVYLTWISYRLIKASRQLLVKALNKNTISIILVLGKKDRLITKRHCQLLIEQVPLVRLIELEAGHASVFDTFLNSLDNTTRSNQKDH